MANEFKLGVLDLYPIAVMGTSIKDSPTVGATLDENVDSGVHQYSQRIRGENWEVDNYNYYRADK